MIPAVDIVIVNWNSGVQLANCLRSIAQTISDKYHLASVVVVDNGSSDASLQGIGDFGLPLKVLANAENRGFAAACNQGAREGKVDNILFLNPDAELLFDDSLARSLDFLNTTAAEKIGIVGIQLVDEHGDVARTCARFPVSRDLYGKALGLDKIWPSRFPGFLLTQWDHAESRVVDHVIGAFFLVRRELFDQLEGFDEHFFVYLEDLDFSLRAAHAGWKSYFMSEAKAFHKGGGTSDQIRAKRIYYSLNSRIIYAFKNYSFAAAASFMLLSLCVEPLIRLCYGIKRNLILNTCNTLIAYFHIYKNIPSLFGKIRRMLNVSKRKKCYL